MENPRLLRHRRRRRLHLVRIACGQDRARRCQRRRGGNCRPTATAGCSPSAASLAERRGIMRPAAYSRPRGSRPDPNVVGVPTLKSTYLQPPDVTSRPTAISVLRPRSTPAGCCWQDVGRTGRGRALLRTGRRGRTRTSTAFLHPCRVARYERSSFGAHTGPQAFRLKLTARNGMTTGVSAVSPRESHRCGKSN
jgi:hypothetical protein